MRIPITSLLLTLLFFVVALDEGNSLHFKLQQHSMSRIRTTTQLHFNRPQNKRNEFDPEEDENDDEIDEQMSKRFPDKRPEGRKPAQTVVKNLNRWEVINRALLAGAFVAGIGSGITIDSAINTNPRDLASRDAIDRNAPNPKICQKYGSSAMVLDQRVFVTFNPFNVYVTQADTKPGCVLRASNVVRQLQVERDLVSPDEMEACKNSFNTWAYIGDINNKPQVNCVYQSDDAQNEFLSNPKIGLGEDVYDKVKTAPPYDPASDDN
jgi:hypothetical protein